jgi:predicted permease
VQALIDVILPVFLVIGTGYLAARLGYLSESAVDGVSAFAQNFALPCLLFAAIARLDLSAALDPALIGSFYAGATAGFIVGLFGARLLFGRSWEDSIAIGFACLFSNSVLLGLPITERAYGPEALEANFAIIAFHAPFCYTLGLTVMEVARNRGGSSGETSRKVVGALLSNPFVLAILAGFLVNLTGLPLPRVVNDALDLLIRAALPAALFGLGGLLVRYRIAGDLRVIGLICAVSLVLHPTIVWTLGRATGLSTEALRSAVITAAMPPGVNAYIFAAMYGVAMRVAASAVLIATALSLVTAWGWLHLLP